MKHQNRFSWLRSRFAARIWLSRVAFIGLAASLVLATPLSALPQEKKVAAPDTTKKRMAFGTRSGTVRDAHSICSRGSRVANAVVSWSPGEMRFNEGKRNSFISYSTGSGNGCTTPNVRGSAKFSKDETEVIALGDSSALAVGESTVLLDRIVDFYRLPNGTPVALIARVELKNRSIALRSNGSHNCSPIW